LEGLSLTADLELIVDPIADPDHPKPKRVTITVTLHNVAVVV